jgi:hypothetical protein
MKLGSEWEFYSDFDPHSDIIVDTLRSNGILYYGFSRSMSETDYWLREKNNRVYCLNEADITEFLLFDFTIDIGDSIELPSGYECSFREKIFLVNKSDTVVTPAGTFYNCYHFKHQKNCYDAGIHDSWFAKGVGKVKYVAEYIVGTTGFFLSKYSTITSTDESYSNNIDNSFRLFQNYPNPFNPSTKIEYTLPSAKAEYNVSLKIYNLLGQLVCVLVNTSQIAGTYIVVWDSRDSKGNKMPSGIYFYVLKAGNVKITKKMLLLK